MFMVIWIYLLFTSWLLLTLNKPDDVSSLKKFEFHS